MSPLEFVIFAETEEPKITKAHRRSGIS